MEEHELLDLCQSTPKTACSLYWTAEIYSFGKYIREYGRFPLSLPLCIYTDHGPGRVDYPFKHELESTAPCQFYHSPSSVHAWKRVSLKPCYVLFSPFVYYRRKYRIEKAANAVGTIAFPAHSTPSIDDTSDIEIYIEQLLSLPVQFQPVSVCLHMHDINKGRHRAFMKRNIPVFTAGNSLDMRFAGRFYNILRNFAYSTSNMVGSYTFYSVEMNIPFSLYGNPQTFVNSGDAEVPVGEYDPCKEFQSFREMSEIFCGLNAFISDIQRDRVEIDLGLRDGVGRGKMCYILYSSFIKWLASRGGFNFAVARAKNKFVRFFA
jgi:hypothetical protein